MQPPIFVTYFYYTIFFRKKQAFFLFFVNTDVQNFTLLPTTKHPVFTSCRGTGCFAICFFLCFCFFVCFILICFFFCFFCSGFCNSDVGSFFSGFLFLTAAVFLCL